MCGLPDVSSSVSSPEATYMGPKLTVIMKEQ
jgi:hypothetical protein